MKRRVVVRKKKKRVVARRMIVEQQLPPADGGSWALAEIKLTKDEEAVLAREPKDDDIRVTPDGAVYLPHIWYTRLFCDAFGRTGWRMVSEIAPTMLNGVVLVPYTLIIHRVPVAGAYGEQRYSEKNKRQSYGDAIESTYASGMRRCAKHLNVALNLWDRRWTDEWLKRCAVLVSDRGEEKWRRRDDPPFPGERYRHEAERKSHEHTQREEQKTREAVRDADRFITDDERREFWRVARIAHPHQDDVIRAWLNGLGYTNSKTIRLNDYPRLIAAVQRKELS